MNVIVCCKFTPNVQDLETRPDGSISLDKAEWQISDYDLQAIEAGVQLVEATGGKLMALSVGTQRIEAAQLRKDLLSRGPEELHLVIDEALEAADTAVVSKVLAAAIKQLGADLVLCGEGSADYYFQQTGAQVGERLSWATLNAIDAIEAMGDRLKVERLMENETEVLEVPLPAVISVTSSINVPKTPGMKAVLSAGKKPVRKWGLAEIGFNSSPAKAIEVINTVAPPMVERKKEVISGTPEDTVAQLVRYLENEGVL